MPHSTHGASVTSTWDVATWDAAQVYAAGYTQKSLLEHILNNNNGDKIPGLRPVTRQRKLNKFVDGGLAELAKRSVGVSTSSEAYHAIGTGTAATLDNDTSLHMEVARKAVGTRGDAASSAKFATVFQPSDITSLGAGQTVNITESSLQTAPLNDDDDIMMVRVRLDAVPISAGRLATFSVNMTYSRGGGSS